MAANVAPRAGAPAGFTFVTASAYDEAGRLVNQTLPDGHRLQYRYAPSDVSKSSGRRPGQLEAILFDDDIVVADIQQTIAGGTLGYTMGNGARERIGLDRQGRIQELQVLARQAGPTGWWGRLTGWFSLNQRNAGTLVYRQVNRYDADGRIVQIDRRSPPGPGAPPRSRDEVYGYDQMNRLAHIQSQGSETDVVYDKGGNRTMEIADGAHTSSDAAPARVTRYTYAPGTNHLTSLSDGLAVAKSAPRDAAHGAQLLRSAWFYHATGVPLAQFVWSGQDEPISRRIVYNGAKRPVAVYANERLVARYFYGLQGERIAKTVYADDNGPQREVRYRSSRRGDTTYYLYHAGRLAAETDSGGRIAAHYIYLNGKAIAKIQMEENDSMLYHQRKIFGVTAADTSGRIFAILVDHLGTPQVVLDQNRRLVWQADTSVFGKTRVVYAAIGNDGKPFQMDLRLPGQLHDAETGLSQNYYRDYDPAIGRYLTPDPIGLAGSNNPYAYASNDPVSRTDSLGLYDIDIHYYMTYTLAVLAGMPELDARRMALATQYIDDNPYTTPIPESSTLPILKDIATQMKRLQAYHFTQAGYDRGQLTGESDLAYEKNRVNDAWNPQLQLLVNAANNPNNQPCGKVQLFGEYLHAFEDTFGHRDQLDDPINLNGGAGHLAYGHEADKTYDEASIHESNPAYFLASGDWTYRASRTLEMEKEVFDKIQKEFHVAAKDASGRPITFASIAWALQAFNSIHENESENPAFPKKIEQLSQLLLVNGFGGKLPNYDILTACKNRNDSLQGLRQSDLPGTILGTPTTCRMTRPQ